MQGLFQKSLIQMLGYKGKEVLQTCSLALAVLELLDPESLLKLGQDLAVFIDLCLKHADEELIERVIKLLKLIGGFSNDLVRLCLRSLNHELLIRQPSLLQQVVFDLVKYYVATKQFESGLETVLGDLLVQAVRKSVESAKAITQVCAQLLQDPKIEQQALVRFRNICSERGIVCADLASVDKTNIDELMTATSLLTILHMHSQVDHQASSLLCVAWESSFDERNFSQTHGQAATFKPMMLNEVVAMIKKVLKEQKQITSDEKLVMQTAAITLTYMLRGRPQHIQQAYCESIASELSLPEFGELADCFRQVINQYQGQVKFEEVQKQVTTLIKQKNVLSSISRAN